MSKGHRIWKTADGKYVADGDDRAAFLAYTPKDNVPQDVLDSLLEAQKDESEVSVPEEDSKPAEARTEPQERKPRRARTK